MKALVAVKDAAKTAVTEVVAAVEEPPTARPKPPPPLLYAPAPLWLTAVSGQRAFFYGGFLEAVRMMRSGDLDAWNEASIEAGKDVAWSRREVRARRM